MNVDLTREVHYLMLNMDEYSNASVYEYLGSLVADDDVVDMDPHVLATNILRVNDGKPLTDFLFDCLVSIYEMAIDDGNDEAMNDLGALYYDGYGVNQDFKKALYYYTMAAQKGNSKAQENLGYCYYYGRSVEVDYEKAYHFFALSALIGSVNSLYKLGDMYLNGYYVSKNEKEAFRIYEQCANMLTEEEERFLAGPVYLRLGNCWLYGYGTTPNYETALYCYQKAELFLIGMVQRGEIMYKNSLQAAIEGQSKTRMKIAPSFPKEIWLDGKK